MAKYINANNDTIETIGSIYIKTVDGIKFAPTDISKWSSNAEKWIDNDILAGYYAGFKKVEAI
jgi:hypothetical protein